MPACERSRRLSAYHDGELPAEERRGLEEHLRQCPSCAQELQQLRSLSGLFAAVEMPGMSSDALGRLHSSVGSIREGLTVRMAGVLAAAAAAVLLVSSVWLCQGWLRPGSDVGWVPAWERVAVTPQVDVPSGAGAVTQLAQWIVEDLSLENGHD